MTRCAGGGLAAAARKVAQVFQMLRGVGVGRITVPVPRGERRRVGARRTRGVDRFHAVIAGLARFSRPALRHARVDAAAEQDVDLVVIAPAFESQPTAIKAVDCIPVDGCDSLFLLPGHIGLSEYDVTLGIAIQSIGCCAGRAGAARLMRLGAGGRTTLADMPGCSPSAARRDAPSGPPRGCVPNAAGSGTGRRTASCAAVAGAVRRRSSGRTEPADPLESAFVRVRPRLYWRGCGAGMGRRRERGRHDDHTPATTTGRAVASSAGPAEPRTARGPGRAVECAGRTRGAARRNATLTSGPGSPRCAGAGCDARAPRRQLEEIS